MEWGGPQVRAGRRYGAPLLLSAAAVILHFVPGARAALQYDRTAVAAGELWRLLSCQLVHGNFDHLFLDVVVTFVLGLIVASRGPGLFLLVCGVSAMVIPLAVHFALPGLSTYWGLSGITSALTGATALLIIPECVRARRWGLATAGVLFALGFFGKITFEAVTGTALFADLESAALAPVPFAHVLGAVVGTLCTLLADRPLRRLRRAPLCRGRDFPDGERRGHGAGPTRALFDPGP